MFKDHAHTCYDHAYKWLQKRRLMLGSASYVLYPVPLLHFARLCITAVSLTPKVMLIFFNYNNYYNLQSDDCT